MSTRKATAEIKLLLALLDEAFDHKGWQGPNLRGALRGLSVKEAVWRPAPGRTNIWQIALHCAYWEYAVRRRLTGEGKRGSFPRRPSNWPALPARCNTAAWKADLALVDEQHRLLREAVASFPAARLGERHGAFTSARLIYGIAAHDIYHTGQIRLLIKLCEAK
ncbi:MAG TPA: DinB family protein [Thermoanaerobaculaceae bacterium]|nr:DinB family protein [Thermoanaerobaculaceae bacterium]